jgi:hypothetical protein
VGWALTPLPRLKSADARDGDDAAWARELGTNGVAGRTRAQRQGARESWRRSLYQVEAEVTPKTPDRDFQLGTTELVTKAFSIDNRVAGSAGLFSAVRTLFTRANAPAIHTRTVSTTRVAYVKVVSAYALAALWVRASGLVPPTALGTHWRVSLT